MLITRCIFSQTLSKLQKIKDKKLRGNLQKLQSKFGELAQNAARSEMLLPEERGYLEAEGMEKTYKVTQDELRKQVDVTTAQKVVFPKNEINFRDSSLISPLLVLILLTTRETDDIYYLQEERDIWLVWTGGKESYIVKFKLTRLFEQYDGFTMSPCLLPLRRSTFTSMTKMVLKSIVSKNILK
jgi:hypothetical protein